MSARRLLGAAFVLGGVALFLAAAPRAQAVGAIERAGDILEIGVPASAFAATLGRHDRPGTWEFLESAAATTFVTVGLKYAVDEKRPDGGQHSFPSGHTSITAQSAEFLRERYGWKWGAPAYVAAAYVGYSRVEAKRHYTHDVLAGAALGMAASAIFTSPYIEVLGYEGRIGICAARRF